MSRRIDEAQSAVLTEDGAIDVSTFAGCRWARTVRAGERGWPSTKVARATLCRRARSEVALVAWRGRGRHEGDGSSELVEGIDEVAHGDDRVGGEVVIGRGIGALGDGAVTGQRVRVRQANTQ